MHQNHAINMNVIQKLSIINNNPNKKLLVKRYLLACCEKFVPYRSRGNLDNGIKLAKKYLQGHKKEREIRQVLWVIEAEAFEIDHYIVGVNRYWPKLRKETQLDLLKTRLRYHLTNQEALYFLRDVSYFVDYTLACVLFSDNDIPKEEDNRFMCPILFNRYFETNV
jgi:hypothetical protein